VERADLNSPGPIPDTHFTFDIVTDPNNPDVTFKAGSTTPWRVWSQVSAADTTPANLGDLVLDASGTSNIYTVEIKNPNVCPGGICNPGAANLASALLNDEDWTGHSSIASGSRITGNLTGNILVVAASGGGNTNCG
jgi:hypothetical protein